MLYWRNHYGGLQYMMKYSILTKGIAASVAMLFLFSCSNDIKEVQEITREDNLPMDVQEDLVLQYSDSSFVRLQLEAPLAESYTQLAEPERKFPKGIEVFFFDNHGVQETRLRANQATNFINKRLWHATGDVVVVNKKGEQLNTEELYWDEKKEIIYSDVFVKITTGKEIIMGEGFEADQNFDNYVISKVTGQIAIEDE